MRLCRDGSISGLGLGVLWSHISGIYQVSVLTVSGLKSRSQSFWTGLGLSLHAKEVKVEVLM